MDNWGSDANGSESSADYSSGQPSGTQGADPANNTGSPQEGQNIRPPFHTHPRWQAMLRQNRETQQQVQELRAELSRRDQAPSQGQLPPDIKTAGDAMLQVMQQHPELSWIGNLKEMREQFDALQQHQAQLAEQAQYSTVEGGQGMIAQLAHQAGYPVNDRTVAFLEELVTAAIRQNPEWHAMFITHRSTAPIIRAAWDVVQKQFLGQLARPTGAVAAKNNMMRLPPAPRGGGLPGAQSAPKIDPNEPKAFERIFDRLMANASGELSRTMG